MTTRASNARNAALALLSLGLCAPTGAAAEASQAAEAGKIRVVGDASIAAPADMVTLQIAVVTEDRSSQAAVAENGRRSNSALQALRKTLGKEAEIETLGFSLHPQYDHTKSSAGRALLRNYRARNVVQVRTSQLERIGEAIDAAAEAGSNEIQSLEFGVRDPMPLRMRALGEATGNAREKSKVIAKALDVRVARVLSLEEGNIGFHQPRMRMEAFSADRATPIEAGAVAITAQVTLTVELAQ